MSGDGQTGWWQRGFAVRWRHVVLAAILLPIAGLLFAWSGLFNVGASGGHWKVTEWFLHFAMRSSVRTYALGVEAPERLPAAGIQPAAGHFARGCAICHGAPGEPPSPAVQGMLPRPPDLAAAVGQWSDAELFRIVKHGVRYTGMPAWPTLERDDEVWAMVDFLRKLPSLDGQAYRRLAYGDPLAGAGGTGLERVIADCARCHGGDGIGGDPVVPVLAGQNEAYLAESLRAFVAGRRASGVMVVAAADLNEEQVSAIARHYATLPPSGPSAADSATTDRGAEIAARGIPDKGVPACLGCHGGAGKSPIYPRLDSQKSSYIEAQLRLFRDRRRGGTAQSHLMWNAARRLSDEDIAALAAYFSGSARAERPE